VTGTVLVAGIGNVFLTDDGFGSEVARRMLDRPLPAAVRIVDYGIRGMHLTYDLLDGYAGLVLVDAMPHGGAPGEITVLEVGPDDIGGGEFDAHGMAPVAALGSLPAMGSQLPPTYVVGCEPADVDEGMGLTPAVEAAVERAIDAVIGVLAEQFGRRPETTAKEQIA
jgi:hydrogenase maturation protease